MAKVYQHKRKDNNEIFYIGISDTYDRPYSKFGRSVFWKKTINKSGGFLVEILFDNISWEEACNKEKLLIEELGRRDLGKGNLVNLTDGGEGGLNHSAEARKKISETHKGKNKPPMSEETKIKISESLKGKIVSEETKIKMSKAQKGKIMPNEAKEKLRSINLGKKYSQETKDKVSKAHKGKLFSEEHKEKLRKPKPPRTIEHCKKISESKKGFKHTEEYKKKQSEIMKEYYKKIKTIK
jgi:hypothetical protein